MSTHVIASAIYASGEARLRDIAANLRVPDRKSTSAVLALGPATPVGNELQVRMAHVVAGHMARTRIIQLRRGAESAPHLRIGAALRRLSDTQNAGKDPHASSRQSLIRRLTGVSSRTLPATLDQSLSRLHSAGIVPDYSALFFDVYRAGSSEQAWRDVALRWASDFARVATGEPLRRAVEAAPATESTSENS